MYDICNNSLTYCYVQDEFLCPGWIYKAYAIYNNLLTYSYLQDAFLCPGWIYEMYDIYVIIHLLILLSKMNFYVQDESTKCLLYSLAYSYVQDEFLCPGWIYEMYAIYKIAVFMSKMKLLKVSKD